jgi:hypothetical protein
MESGGFRGGYEDTTLEKLAKKAKEWKVNEVLCEGNFGDGMFLKIFSPVLQQHHKCALTETKSTGQKEVRIADTLEPVMGAHRLIVLESAIAKDYQSARNTDGVHDVKYSLFYQMTRLTRERGAIAHDDRLDALAIGVSYFVEHMEKNSKVGADDLTEEWLMEQLDEDRIHSQLNDMVIHNGDIEIMLGSDEDAMWDDLNVCDWDR